MTTVLAGADAESRATRLLVRQGYQIVERNFRCKSGELDIIARDGDILCFVEVRSRADHTHGHAAEMVDARKQAQVSRIALHYIGLRNPRFERSRFDVVAITGEHEILIQDAWRPRPD
jgi:putative endonuclease